MSYFRCIETYNIQHDKTYIRIDKATFDLPVPANKKTFSEEEIIKKYPELKTAIDEMQPIDNQHLYFEYEVPDNLSE